MGTAAKAPLLLAGSALAAGTVVYLASRRASAASSPPDRNNKPKPGPKPLVAKPYKVPKPKPAPEPSGGGEPEPSQPSPTQPQPPTVQQVRQAVLDVREGLMGLYTRNLDDYTRAVVVRAGERFGTIVPPPTIRGDKNQWPKWMKDVETEILKFGIEQTLADREKMAEWWRTIFSKSWEKPGPNKTWHSTLRELLKKKKRKEKWWSWVGDEAGSGTVANKIRDWAEKIVLHGPALLWLNGPAAKKACEGRGDKASRARCMATDEILVKALVLPGPKGAYGQLKDNPPPKWRSRNTKITDESLNELGEWFLAPFKKKYWSSVSGSINDNTGLRARIYDAAVYLWPTALANLALQDKYTRF